MTLASVPPYDSTQRTDQAGQAVVVGAGMAGLLAARVLADYFERVTVVERDSLPADPVARNGVPQGNHIHNLHEAGRRTLEDLFPGFSDELVAAGGTKIDFNSDFHVYVKEGFLAHGPSQIPMYCASRPLFELLTRRRLRDFENVSLREQCHFVDFRLENGTTTVDGVSVREGGTTEELPADLVVDATGRASRTPAWLEEHGYPSPTVDEIQVDLAYSTAIVDRPPDANRGVVVVPHPPQSRGGGLFPVEDDRWIMTLFGMHGDHAPSDLEGFLDFAASLPVPDFADVIAEHGVIDDEIQQYPFPSNRRVRYEAVDRFPGGVLVIGDGIASFNPIYGQGMSVAALEAIQLHHALAAGRDEDLARRYFRRIEQVIDDAWMLAAGSDFQFSQTSGPKPTATDLINRYMSRLFQQAQTDRRVAEAFYRVTIMERRPASLFRPGVLWRVLVPGI